MWIDKVTGMRQNNNTSQFPGDSGATGNLDTGLKGREEIVRDPSTAKGRARLAGRALSYLPPPPPTYLSALARTRTHACRRAHADS